MKAAVKRHRYLVLPDPARFPKSRKDWVRLGVVLSAVVVLVAGLIVIPRVWPHVVCRDGRPGGDVWQSGGECVGLADGPYAFGLVDFEPVMRTIHAQNAAAAERCDPNGTTVTVGVLLTMTDPFAGARAVHELEGMAAGQARANGTGCLHPMRLLVGNTGAYRDTRTPVEVAQRMAERSEVVAVAGIGLSHQLTAEVADVLAEAKLPMVADLITAEGFDQNGSREDQPDFSRCDRDITYTGGIGKGFYYRVAFRAAVQIARLREVVAARPGFIMVPTGGSDPYTCTALPLMQRAFGGNVTEVKFDPDQPSTVPQTANRVCGATGDLTVGSVARGRDLARFLYSLDEAFKAGQCAAGTITVVSTSDGNRLRVAESAPVAEDYRVKALTSAAFRSGRIKLVLPLVSGTDQVSPEAPGFAEFERQFAAVGFDLAHGDAGWAVNAYDALTTVSTALRTLSTGDAQRGEVNSAISGFSSPTTTVAGAGGPISFDNAGNRNGSGPPVVRVCPPAGEKPARVRSVRLEPGTPMADCPS